MKMFCAVWLGIAISACGSTTEDAPEALDTERAIDGRQALARFPGVEVLGSQYGVPDFIRGDLGDVAPVSEEPARGPGEGVRERLDAVAPVFRLQAGDLVFLKQSVDTQGHRHLRFQQHHQGLPVIGGELMMHVDPRGHVYAINSTARGGAEVVLEAKVAPEAAVEVALRGSHATQALVSGPLERVFLRPEPDLDLRLAWQVRVKGEREGLPVDDLVYVDAKSGALLAVHPRIHSALNRRVYTGRNATTLPGTLVRSEGQSPHSDPIVNNNYNHLGTFYDCYQDLFGRDSFDNAGGALHSTVHHRVNYVNAFWDGIQMVYGDGDGVNASNLANSLDVTAHELTHAVTDYESELIYSGESGGLNESMSDIFGAVCEWFGDGRVVSNGTWLVGDDVWTPSIPNDGLRYMANPTQDGDSLDCYHDFSSGTDVHYSSGITNLAFYLLSQGGTHPRGRTTEVVAGIGIEKAARIFYKANTDILLSSSNFEAAKVATEQAAWQLGYDAATIASVSSAWKAVCVGATPPDGSEPRPIPDAVVAPLTLATLFTDPPRHDDETQPSENFLPDRPILLDGQTYTAEQIRAQDIYIAHYVLDARSESLNVVQGFRSSAALQAYLTSTGQYPSEQPTSQQLALCNQHSVFFEHDNYSGNYFTAAPGYALFQLGGWWNDRISSVRATPCTTWTVLSEHSYFTGYRLWVRGGFWLHRLRNHGWYAGFLGWFWYSWNDRASAVAVTW